MSLPSARCSMSRELRSRTGGTPNRCQIEEAAPTDIHNHRRLRRPLGHHALPLEHLDDLACKWPPLRIELLAKLPEAHGHLDGGPRQFSLRTLLEVAQREGDSGPCGRALSHLPREDSPRDVRATIGAEPNSFWCVNQVAKAKDDMFFMRFEHKLQVE